MSKAEDSTEEKKKERKSFWETVPGILTALAALVTAIGGCIATIVASPRILDIILPSSPTPIILTSTSARPKDTQPPSFTPTPVVVVITEIATHPLVQTPRIYGFSACLQSCNGTNATRVLPEGTTKIYAQWNYENIPIGADYTRTWTMNGREWIRYACTWPGPTTGIDTVTLTEPKGLHSGIWEVTISVNGAVLLQEQIQVQGKWDYWDPAGSFNSCYGQR